MAWDKYFISDSFDGDQIYQAYGEIDSIYKQRNHINPSYAYLLDDYMEERSFVSRVEMIVYIKLLI